MDNSIRAVIQFTYFPARAKITLCVLALGVRYLGLIVGSEDFGPTLHRGVIILKVLLDLFHGMGAAVG